MKKTPKSGKSCAVALTIERNCASHRGKNATSSTTCNATMSLKALASKVLERNRQRNQSATAPEKRRNFRRNSTPLKVALNLSGCTINELQKLGGDDWIENPEIREAFAKAVATRKLREQGIKPDKHSPGAGMGGCSHGNTGHFVKQKHNCIQYHENSFRTPIKKQ